MRVWNNLIVPKNVEVGTLWNFSTSILLPNVIKSEGGYFGDITKFRKVSAIKNQKAGPFSLVRFFYVTLKKEKNEKGTLCSK